MYPHVELIARFISFFTCFDFKFDYFIFSISCVHYYYNRLSSMFKLESKGRDRRCLTEARVPSFNGKMLDSKPTITSFNVYFYVLPFFSPLHLGTRASLRHESVTAVNIVESSLSFYGPAKSPK